eukprot:1693046-Prymnesium_polylepis.1
MRARRWKGTSSPARLHRLAHGRELGMRAGLVAAPQMSVRAGPSAHAGGRASGARAAPASSPTVCSRFIARGFV